jgi:hypothetical protein
MKKLTYLMAVIIAASIIYSCGGNSTPSKTVTNTDSTSTGEAGPESYDPKRGEGKYNADNVKVGAALDVTMATEGEKISGTKCTSCHKLTDEKLVGPGWKGVTERRTPFWIMNFISNPDPMIDKDPAVQAQLELCLVRMPNQGLGDNDARNIVEFMRKNDGVK